MRKFKRFLMFEYGGYNPRGGLSNITAEFDTIEEAKATITRYLNDREDLQTRYIFDRIEGEVVIGEIPAEYDDD